jgi:hypothetical protein
LGRLREDVHVFLGDGAGYRCFGLFGVGTVRGAEGEGGGLYAGSAAECCGGGRHGEGRRGLGRGCRVTLWYGRFRDEIRSQER